MVARREGTGEYEITALLDWDDAMAVPVEMAFSMPSFLLVEQDECSGSGSSGLTGKKSKHIERRRSHELQSLFQDEIIKLIPDFLDIVKSSERARKLGWFAAYGLHCSHDAAAADKFLESVGIKRVWPPHGAKTANETIDH
jgi:hypothetical protein